ALFGLVTLFFTFSTAHQAPSLYHSLLCGLSAVGSSMVLVLSKGSSIDVGGGTGSAAEAIGLVARIMLARNSIETIIAKGRRIPLSPNISLPQPRSFINLLP